MLVYFLIRNQNNTSVLFHYSEKNREMNKEIRIKNISCYIQVQFGLENRELVIYDITKCLIKLSYIDSE